MCFTTQAVEQRQTGGLVHLNNFDKCGGLKRENFYMENLDLFGDNNIQISVFALLSLKICITDEQFLHFQCQLLELVK